MSDPLGRRALFSPPAGAARPPGRHDESGGKESLYSGSPEARRAGTLVVECSSCRARSRLGFFEFAWRHLPVWLWIPWVRYSNLMVCPACGRRTWLGVTWLT